MTLQLNGIAHVYITVQDFAAARPFYARLLPELDMQCLIDTEVLYYCVGSRTGIAIRAASEAHADTPFDPYRAGMHHLCLRARSRDDVDAVATLVAEIVADTGGRIVHAPQEDDWAPGYYSVLFEDPGGTRLEVNYVPGKGNLAEAVELPLPQERQGRLSEP